MSKISLRQQIEEIDRELNLRRPFYAGRVRSGKMRQSIADMHIARMEAARNTLAWLQENEQAVKDAVLRRAETDQGFAQIRENMKS